MRNGKNSRTCPVELAGGLDNLIRRLLQNPQCNSMFFCVTQCNSLKCCYTEVHEEAGRTTE